MIYIVLYFSFILIYTVNVVLFCNLLFYNVFEALEVD